MEGRIEAITLVKDPAGTIERVEAAEATPVGGLEGDYHHDLTLITAEALEALWTETGIHLGPHDSRRNVLTRGIDLNALVGCRFTIGGVEAEGVEPAEPCTKLQRLTEEPGVLRGLVHRGGLRANIVSGGRFAVGDSLGRPEPDPDTGR